MTQPTNPPGTVPAPRPRGLLGPLAGVLPRRRGARDRRGERPVWSGADPLVPVAGDRPAPFADDPEPSWWDVVRGEPTAGPADGRAPWADGLPAAELPVAGRPATDVAVAERSVAESPLADAPLSRAEGWLSARSVSGVDGLRTPVPGHAPALAPVRVPAWPAWVASTTQPGTPPATDDVVDRAAVAATTTATMATMAQRTTVPSVVRVSAARPAPARAPFTTRATAVVPAATPVAAPAAVVPSPSPAPAGADAVPPAAAPHDRPEGAVADAAATAGAELVLTDGRRLTMTSTLLVGRNPAPRAGETVGGLVVVEDPARSVSKTHLTVGVDDAGVWVVDRHSTNGTVVTLPDGQRILCVPERRVRLVAGASVLFGDHGFTLAATTDR